MRADGSVTGGKDHQTEEVCISSLKIAGIGRASIYRVLGHFAAGVRAVVVLDAKSRSLKPRPLGSWLPILVPLIRSLPALSSKAGQRPSVTSSVRQPPCTSFVDGGNIRVGATSQDFLFLLHRFIVPHALIGEPLDGCAAPIIVGPPFGPTFALPNEVSSCADGLLRLRSDSDICLTPKCAVAAAAPLNPSTSLLRSIAETAWPALLLHFFICLVDLDQPRGQDFDHASDIGSRTPNSGLTATRPLAAEQPAQWHPSHSPFGDAPLAFQHPLRLGVLAPSRSMRPIT